MTGRAGRIPTRRRVVGTLLLCAASGCVWFGAEPAEPGQEPSGGGGETAPPVTCETDPGAFCEGVPCREVSACGERCTQECLRWRVLSIEGALRPPPLRNAAIRCDEEDGAIWIYGGEERRVIPDAGSGPCGPDPRAVVPSSEIWRLSPTAEGGRWERIEPVVAPGAVLPSPRARAAMLPVGPRSFALFGGMQQHTDDSGCEVGQEIFGDAWLFAGGAWQPLVGGALPAARFGAYVATDPADGSSYVLGGTTASHDGADFGALDGWRFDPGTATFAPVSQDLWGGTRVGPRVPVNGVAVRAGDADGIVALGGRDGDLYRNAGARSYLEEASRLVGVEGELRWEAAPALALPFPAELFGAVFVPGLGLVAHGGYADGYPRVIDSWVREDGQGWRKLTGPGTGTDRQAPGGRSSYSLAFCEAFGGVVLFGGEPDGIAPSNTTFVLSTP